ncbi:hypothetical protein Mapa_009653 [Marchantia paleacea]|nr:hypothetical protein Mapa_009653 [Marchantia paleacea]
MPVTVIGAEPCDHFVGFLVKVAYKYLAVKGAVMCILPSEAYQLLASTLIKSSFFLYLS